MKFGFPRSETIEIKTKEKNNTIRDLGFMILKSLEGMYDFDLKI